MQQLRELVERTPARRVCHVDLLRAVAIVAVVVGHWLVIAIEDEEGPRGFSALQQLTWAHALTWLFQVMPLFFIVGGFANAISLTSQRSRGGDAASWVRARSARLIRPTTVLLIVLAGASLVARLLGADAELVGTAAWLASVPLWFLVVYLVAVLLTPAMHALHRRAGLPRSPSPAWSGHSSGCSGSQWPARPTTASSGCRPARCSPSCLMRPSCGWHSVTGGTSS